MLWPDNNEPAGHDFKDLVLFHRELNVDTSVDTGAIKSVYANVGDMVQLGYNPVPLRQSQGKSTFLRPTTYLNCSASFGTLSVPNGQ